MKNKIKAFSIGEMMIVLLVLSIILAASMPIITKRSKSTVDKTWQAATNGSDAYFGTGETQGIAIGSTGFPGGSFGKLLLNVANAGNINVSHILFSATNGDDFDILGKLRLGESQLEFGANATAANTNTMALGHNSLTNGENAMALGHNANAADNNTISIGISSVSNGANATSVGVSANATSALSVALGYGAIANGANATSVGASANATNVLSLALGYGAVSNGANATSVGASANATNVSSLALGYGAVSNGANATSVGASANATNDSSLAIGYGAFANGPNSIALGSSANASGNYSIAIGSGVVAGDKHLNLGGSSNISNISIGLSDSSSQVINIGATGATVNFHGTVKSDSAVVVPSDIRKKNILGEYKSGLDDIMKIKIYNFTYKQEPKVKRVGVIAQELKKIFPNAVVKDNEGFLAIRTEDMFYAVINAIKELNNRINNLAKENIELKKQVKELSKRIELLEKQK